MKTILLFRHAKSSRDDAGLRDYDRPLAARGLRDAPRMGDEIARRGWVPDITLVSAARRTRETWMLASKAMGAEVPATFLDSIYEAEWQTLLAALRGVDPAIDTALMVGHNPGMEDLIHEPATAEATLLRILRNLDEAYERLGLLQERQFMRRLAVKLMED